MKYRLFNNITGWVVFLIASYTYLTTIEPTASFWDCGEFIATAYKLEVGHPPGAPFFMILARFFALFAGDPSNVAMMVNAMSGLASAFTILFLFWTITHLAGKIVRKDNEEMNIANLVAILGSGVIGALAYTFSDTFWFSAVEGEVYATSSLFTAVVFWAILKWENVADQKYANRWIVLIAFLMGLSIGVHLLNLLAIPAIIFVYYFKKYTPTRKGIIYASILSVVLLGLIMYGIIPGVVTMASYFERFCINFIGFPYNTGVLLYAVLLIFSLVLGLYYTSKPDAKPFPKGLFFSMSMLLLGLPLITTSFLVLLTIPAVFIIGWYLAKKSADITNTILLCCTVILIGYSSFSMIVIRSFANPPMDENNPENVFALLAYLNREQYGDRPLVYGNYFNAPLDEDERYTEGDPVFIQKNGKYVVSTTKDKPNYNAKYLTLFPRMWSAQKDHINAYVEWGDIDLRKIYDDPVKRTGAKAPPGFFSNLKFFFKYQLGHMYLRYFMWNFAGRQNDIQGHGNHIHGNWLTGIPAIDEELVGPQDKLPDKFAGNKAWNKLYLMPLILGLFGLIFQYQRNSRGFLIVLLLFFFTGAAIVMYLNQYPYQPRERDYAYAASFYAFAIWIGLGMMALYNAAKKLTNKNFFITGAIVAGITLFIYMVSAMFQSGFAMAMIMLVITIAYFIAFGLMKLAGLVRIGILHAILALILAIPVPVIMAMENWDDHNRSERYIARDFAKNYLNSCAKNALLITYGDNDTFPLWYAQEVEGVRTDVRVLCFTLFNTDWYADQMARKAYESEAVPFSLTHDQYVQGTRDLVYCIEDKRVNEPVALQDAMKFIASDDVRTKLPPPNQDLHFIPTKTLRLYVDSAKVVESGTVKPGDAGKIVPYIDIKIKGNFLQKNEIMFLDFLAQNNWERPVYFTSMGDMAFSLRDYLQLEGFAFRLVPIRTPGNAMELGRIDSDILYDNLMNKFEWGNLNKQGIYLDQTIIRTTNIVRIRNSFVRLAQKLIEEGKKDSAESVLDRCMEVMPKESVEYDFNNVGVAECYFRLQKTDKANDVIKILVEQCKNELDYYLSLEERYAGALDYDRRIALRIFKDAVDLTKNFKQTDLHELYDKEFQEYYMRFAEMEQIGKAS